MNVLGSRARVLAVANPTAIERGGGTDGNERLTATTGMILIALLAIEGVTLFTLSSLLSLHIFIGVVLIPPVLLKLGSTGYRFMRYYTGKAAYVRKGPPPLYLRALGPIVVLSTGVLLASGVALLAMGRGDSFVRTLHTLSFIVFFAATSLHVLGHLWHLPSLAAADWRRRARLPGRSARNTLLLASLIAGLAFGTIAVSFDGSWVHHHRRSFDVRDR
jgi:hypothetical protein